MILRSLYSKIALGVVSILLMSVAAIGVTVYLVTESHLETSGRSELEFYADHYLRDILSKVDEKKRRLLMVAQGEQYTKYYENYRDLVLRKYFMQFGDDFPVLSYVNEDGEEEVKVVNGTASNTLSEQSGDTLFEKSVWNPGRVILEPVYFSTELQTYCMRFALTTFSYFGDNFQGMLMAQVPFRFFEEYLSSIRVGKRGAVTLISDTGTVLAQSRGEHVGRRLSASEGLIEILTQGEKGFFRASVLDTDSVFAFAPVEGTNWSLVVSLPVEEFRAVSHGLISSVLLISAGILLLVLIISSKISRKIVEPIIKMTKASRDISGDISEDTFKRRVEISSADEIGTFAEQFNLMMDKIEEFSQSLSLEKKYIENLMGSMLNAIIVMDLDMEIIDVNESACAMLGYPREELLTKPFGMLLKEDMEALKTRLLEERSVPNEEKMLVKKRGDMIYTFVSFSLVEGDRGTFDRVLCVAEDITEIKIAEELLRKSHDDMEAKVHERTAALMELNQELEIEIIERNRAEQNLVKINEKLEMRNRELQEFAYVASHDLQEPLRKITAFGDRLRDKYGQGLGEQGNDYLVRMQSAAGRMHDLISSLLMFSRVTTRARPFSPVDLNIVAKDILSDLEVLIEQSGGRVELGDLETIEADPVQMQQVLLNLIGNALKFHKKDTVPLVKVYGTIIHDNGSGYPKAEKQKMFQLIVEDNGIGFDRKYADRIFGVFQRLHGRKEYEGTGIGLSICRRIVERHGGSIVAESSPGEGASFIVTLPVHQCQQDAQEKVVI